MFLKRILARLVVSVFVLTAAPYVAAQETSPAARPAQVEREEQEPIKVFTEEVRLPVVAYNDHGHFDPTVEPDDIFVLENDVPQQPMSVRRHPSYILLLLDMGSQTNLAKSTTAIRDIAIRLLQSLRAGDQVCLIQFGDRAEVLQDWTPETKKVLQALDPRRGRLLSGRRSRLAEGIMAAADKLHGKPVGNTHVILITDGAETPSNRVSYAEAVKRLVAAQTAVHVISYTTLMRQAVKHRNSNIFDLDREMKRWFRDYGEAMKQSEEQLVALAEEAGGRIWLPTSAEEALEQCDEVARDIGAQYVVTYRPKRPFTSAGVTERRRVRVFPRRVGLRLLALRSYVVITAR